MRRASAPLTMVSTGRLVHIAAVSVTLQGFVPPSSTLPPSAPSVPPAPACPVPPASLPAAPPPAAPSSSPPILTSARVPSSPARAPAHAPSVRPRTSASQWVRENPHGSQRGVRRLIAPPTRIRYRPVLAWIGSNYHQKPTQSILRSPNRHILIVQNVPARHTICVVQKGTWSPRNP